jgi:Leucine-rich repeat (LRR) protein
VDDDYVRREIDRRVNDVLKTGEKRLDLSDLQFAELPESISELSALEALVLSGTGVRGLPRSLRQLRDLQHLMLDDNDFTDVRKVIGVVGDLPSLTALSLAGNGLTFLPTSFQGLQRLRKLDLERNRFAELPDELENLTSLVDLNVEANLLASLPGWLDRLSGLESLNLSRNRIEVVPDRIGLLSSLVQLDLDGNQIRTLPASFGSLKRLRTLWLGVESAGNPLGSVPDVIRQLESLLFLGVGECQLEVIPGWVGELPSLQGLNASNNQLRDLPLSLVRLTDFYLDGNPLNPELQAAVNEGAEAIIRYLRARSSGQVVLNEAKLILVGEGEVGKSSLLAALRADPWEDDRITTHGIEIRPLQVTDTTSGTEVTLNGWDFGGQRVYRPTHQLFFSSPAVYLVVWKPREGPQQGFVKEWIRLIQHREPQARILVVATHGGPKERQPDIDRQDLWDLFGREAVVDFFHVDSRPPALDPAEPGSGIVELKAAIARVAVSLPEVGRSVPLHWQEARRALVASGVAYLPLERVFEICELNGVDEPNARILLRICHRVGDLIHYEHDPALHDIVVLKPDWLATAISFVLDDKITREANGLVSFERLRRLWDDEVRSPEFRYPVELHPLFLRLMERFDLSYKVSLATDLSDEIGFWQRVRQIPEKAPVGGSKATEIRYTSLVAQLVPDIRPDDALNRVWPDQLADGDEEQVQVCKIVEANTGQSAAAEGLFYQLIVRLHRFSLGRHSFRESVHWQRGLVLDDDYNGRALMEHHVNDVRITVRAPYPEKFLSVLTREVEWLAESFWEGLRCDTMVPCIEPCGRQAPGTGLFEVAKLIESKRRRRPEYPCHVCHEWQSIDHLLRNAPASRPEPLPELLAEFASVKAELSGARVQLMALRGEARGRFDQLDMSTQRILSRIDDAYTGLMRTLTDEGKDGPRLFSIEPVEPGFLGKPKWLAATMRVTLWCEHSRLPLPALNGAADTRGVYTLSLPRDWFVKAAPFLKLLTGTLSLVVPVASSATKLLMDEAAYKSIEQQLDLGQKTLDSVMKLSDLAVTTSREKGAPKLEDGTGIDGNGGLVRQLQGWVREQDAGFGGLVRVQNKRQEFLWVHEQFAKEY